MRVFWTFCEAGGRLFPRAGTRRPPARSRERQASRRLARKKRYGNTECRRLNGSQLLPCSLIVRKERKAMRMDSRSRIALPPCVGFPKCSLCVFLYVSWVFKIRYKFPLTTMRIGSWRKGGTRGVEVSRLMAFCRGRRPRLRLPGEARKVESGGWAAAARVRGSAGEAIITEDSAAPFIARMALAGMALASRAGPELSGRGQRRALGP